MESKKLVYVAGPISKGDLPENIKLAHEVGLRLLRAGFAVIVPHGSCFWGNRRLGDAFLPEKQPSGTTHADWLDCDLEIVRRCDCLLRLPGESKGADMEEAEAKRVGIPIYYSVDSAIADLPR